LTSIDTAISAVGGVRADLGALQNRFESTIRNLSNISENLAGARSQIRDTDFATETAELTRNQIIQQASISVLSQANQKPQSALALLG
jgi:flagellin